MRIIKFRAWDKIRKQMEKKEPEYDVIAVWIIFLVLAAFLLAYAIRLHNYYQ